MRTFRCKCGDKIRWSSMGEGHDCEGCDICNTTFASRPEGHKELKPHEWEIKYNQNTGKPYKRCKNCSQADAESFRKSEISESNNQ